MGWRDRHPFPLQGEFESDEEYQERLESYYDAEDDAAEEYIERKKLEE